MPMYILLASKHQAVFGYGMSTWQYVRLFINGRYDKLINLIECVLYYSVWSEK